MLGALRKWFTPEPPVAVEDTYIALVAAARNPFFYTDLQVPDTIDGRFDLIVLHLFLLQLRLLAAEPEFGQFLSETFFRDMDRSLREMGVADTGVSKRIKKMGKAYHGRLQAYSAAMDDENALCSALARNLYGTLENGDIGVLKRMAHYVEAANAQLAATDLSLITSGQFRWPDVAAIR